jgi:hypothetical protein
MKKINDYLIMIIGNYLRINDVMALSQTCKRCQNVFKSYFEYYKRECKSMFTENYKVNHFKNLLMYKPKLTISNNVNKYDPGFLCKGTATKIWRDLVKEGVSLNGKWSNFTTEYEPLSGNILANLGD